MVENNQVIYSVSEISNIISNAIKSVNLEFYVRGEIVSVKLAKTILYVKIADKNNVEDSTRREEILVLVFSPLSYKLSNDLKVGDDVVVKGKLSYYAHTSSVTIFASNLVKDQNEESLLLLKKKQTIEFLEKNGYLDPSRKKKLPKYVSKIGVISSKTAAGFNDFKKVFRTKYPAKIILYDAMMQGKDALNSILDAIKKASLDDLDCLVITRGGGSSTDLDIFNEKELAIALADFDKPIITAIGHFHDNMVIDLVASYAAGTPTDAAKMINPTMEECYQFLADCEFTINDFIDNKLKQKQLELSNYSLTLKNYSPYSKHLNELESKRINLKHIIKSNIEKVTNYLQKSSINIKLCLNSNLNKNKEVVTQLDRKLQIIKINYQEIINRFNLLCSKIELLNPNLLLNKGYTYVSKNGILIKSSQELKKNDEIDLTFSDGNKKAKII